MAIEKSTQEAFDKLVVNVSPMLGFRTYESALPVIVNRRQCIAKKFHIESHEKELSRELKEGCVTLSGLKHPNIVDFIGIHIGANSHDVSLISERLSTDLASFAENNPNTNIAVHLRIFRDIAEGLVYLHSLSPPLIHGNLSAFSIFLTKELTAKIGDIEVFSTVDSLESSLDIYNMPVAPGADLKTTDLDVFSFGTIILHTVIGRLSFLFPTELINFKYMAKGVYELQRRKGGIYEEMGSEHCLHDVMTECLLDKPDRRPTAQQLKERLSQIQQQYVALTGESFAVYMALYININILTIFGITSHRKLCSCLQTVNSNRCC